ncbi:MAG: TIGR03435 family protein [Candidatus Acidiferrales bacterium]
MKSRAIFICVLMGVGACAAANVCSAQAPPQAPPKAPPPPAMIGPAPPSPEAQRLATLISAYATAQCGGKDSAAAPDCWAKSLWDGTQCPPQDTSANNDASANKDAAATSQPCVPGGPGFVYDVASIKEVKDDGTRNSSGGGGTADGDREVNVTMWATVHNAYSRGLQLQVTGGPSWLNQTRYDIEAKFVPEVGDALKKLSQDDRGFVRRYMMQQLLKERMNFAAHVETKEVPSFDLIVGKNGPRLRAADPTAKDNGSMRMQPDQGRMVITGKGIGMISLASLVQNYAGRPVFDKTGLTGMYDLKLVFAPVLLNGMGVGGPLPPGVSAAGNGPDLPADPGGGQTVMAAIEEQLGLKLVPSRGPMMVVVIEHMDKPDAN